MTNEDRRCLRYWDTTTQALEQKPKYCNRNICLRNEYNSIGCDECKVTKSQKPKTIKSCDTCKHDEAFGCPSFIHDRCENYSEWEQAESEDQK